ncbi:MAG: prevent-host-death protein [Acidobacteriota bacterium]|jgi:antitoxin (DNA-binding transcriptional repressor) of toxin-antitoxin stability system|nr:prevent-host-death protein [Acidobacteriota bacterium]
MSVYFQKIETSGEELIVTDRGCPVLKTIPFRIGCTVQQTFDDLRGKVRTPEPDLLMTPLTDEWEMV